MPFEVQALGRRCWGWEQWLKHGVSDLGPSGFSLWGPSSWGAPGSGAPFGLGGLGAHTPKGTAACVTLFHGGPEVNMDFLRDSFFFCSVHVCRCSLDPCLPCSPLCQGAPRPCFKPQTKAWKAVSGASAHHCFPREATDASFGSKTGGTHLLPF